MNELIIDNHVIKKNIRAILSKLKGELTNGKLADIRYTGDQVAVTCPYHNYGKESHPSCFIYIGDNEKIPWGTFHCFTCGQKGNLVKFIATAADRSEYYAKEWLKKNFTEKITNQNILDIDKPIELYSMALQALKEVQTVVNEDILSLLQSWHPYMEQRHISKEIAERFQVKYDPKTESIVFPVKDKNGNLIFLTTRSIKEKKFHIDSSADKIVYLLYETIRNKYKQVIVVESQINALVSYSYGFPAVALFGAGTTKSQIEELNSTNILHYILMYDNDDAGRKGAERFKKLIRNDVFVTDIIMPKNKDVADCTKEEFWNILKENNITVDFSVK